MTTTPVSRMSIAHPVLFPCGDRVTVPQIGADETKLKGLPLHLSETGLPFGRPDQVKETFKRNYLKKVSADLLFSEDVVRVHAAHTLPYNKDDIHETFKYSDIIQRERKRGSTGPTGRHDARGTDKKHLPCHIKTVSHHHLKPLHKKPKPKKLENISEDSKSGSDSKTPPIKTDSYTFLTQDPLIDFESRISPLPTQIKQTSSESWDEHLLKNLSKNTARWIVNEKTGEGPHRDKLNRLVVDLHGLPTHPVDTLIRDDASDITDVDSKILGNKDWSKLKLRLSASKRFRSANSKTRKKTADDGGDDSWEDDDSDDDPDKRPLASFYKLPGGMRRQQKQMEKQLAGAVNTTARDIKVSRKKTQPPPTLRDVMNPAVGDKMFDTRNQFEQEWLSGALQVHKQDSSLLVLDTGNKYQVLRQENFPQDPHTWFPDSDKRKKLKKPTDDNGRKKSNKRTKIPHKGYKKWSMKPEPIQEGASIEIHEAGYDSELYREPDPAVRKQHRENPALVKLVDEWRTKWHLGNKWYESSVEDLVRDMSDINEHVRLQTIATIARAATFRPPDDPGIPVKNAFTKSAFDVLGKTMGHENDVKHQAAEGHLPPKLLECVEKALVDTCDRVRVTAAIALYTLSKPNEEARTILRRVIRSGQAPERWAAAQCLAHAGVCDSYVVGELVQQIFGCENVVKFEQCVSLMAKLSRTTTIVHSMVAEQLNSTSWRHRIVACRVLPRLSGTINKDITHKLANIMWNDWHKEVRMVAAQTLGKTGHGKEVHNELRERLVTGSERDRIDALSKIGHLGIMTARLLPSYLSCFDDVYISVRIAAVTTASKLLLEEEKVITKLLFLTQYDNNWRVKAHALKALGDIGILNDNIQAAIIWAVRFENEPGVRAEACRTLVRVQIRGQDVAGLLQDKLLVEPDDMVRTQLSIALESMGVSPTGDMEMVQQIKDEVRRLCTRGNIAAKIAQSEAKEDRVENHERFFNVPPSPGQSPSPDIKKIVDSVLRPTTKQSTRSETPSINITSGDKDDGFHSPDAVLPNTPISEVSEENTQYLSPTRANTPRANSPSRRTPEEKIDKLIELYDGVCSIKEYNDYVKPEDEDGEEENSKELEPIVENAKGEDFVNAMIQTNDNDDDTQLAVMKDNGHIADDGNEEELSKRSLLLSPTKTLDMVNALEADIELSIDQRSDVPSAASDIPTE